MSNRRKTGQMNHLAGEAAERRVVQLYQDRGLRLAERRWRGKAGEVDLILRDGTALVFVEVKHSRTLDRAALRVGARQMERLCAAAEEFAANEPSGLLTEMRFDVALVDGAGRAAIIENAFGADSY